MPEIIGILGALCVCLAYGLLQLNLNPKGLFYNLLNLFGSILLGYSLIYNWNSGSMAIEVFWFLIALSGIVSIYKDSKLRAESSFLTPLKYETFGNKNYSLTEPFSFYYYGDLSERICEHKSEIKSPVKDSHRSVLTVPHSFITDFASIPSMLHFVFTPDGIWSKAATLHDFLYRSKYLTDNLGISRKQADRIFLLSMRVSRVPILVRYSFYFAVRLFGSSHWKYYKSKDYTFIVGDHVILDPIMLGYENVDRMIAFEQAQPERVTNVTRSKIRTSHREYCPHALLPYKD